jgi:two-component system, NtrC family, sensor kinase
MEATFDEMQEHEEQMRLALQLENAVRDQYAHEAQLVIGERAQLEYESARSRALELIRTLVARVQEPDAVARLEHIREASAQLDRLFRDQVAPAVQRRDPIAAITHDRSYPLVSLIEDDIDRIFGRLEEATSASRHELVDLERAALRWTALLLMATPVLVAAAVLYLSRSVARPLARLSQGAATLAAGDLDARIDVDTPDEFGALAADFNAMTVALKQHQQRLVESEKLAGIGRLAAGVAHELNNPLQVMLGYLSLNRDVPDRRLAEQLAAVEEEALRCKNVIDGLLELARPTVTPDAVDLRRVCEDVAGGLRVAVQAAPLRLSVDGAALALGDGVKLRQAVFNLMKNAVEAAGPAGDVRVVLGASGDEVEVAVCDSGPGVASEGRARLFEPFFTTKSTGTGLGLAVSRAIALAHGGDIEVENGSPGGAVFKLRLPRAPEGRQ